VKALDLSWLKYKRWLQKVTVVIPAELVLAWNPIGCLCYLPYYSATAVYRYLDQDVFINAVGGVRIAETGADLAVILAILSSYRDLPVSNRFLVFGEVGLSGEIRPVPNGEDRLREAGKHGFETAIIPKANMPKRDNFKTLRLIPVNHLADTLDAL